MADEYVLTADSARRVADAVRTIERMPVNTVQTRTQQRQGAGAMAFKVTTQISAATGQLVPGHGFGTMLDFNPTTGHLIVPTSTLLQNIKIWSLAETTIGVNSTVQCVSMYGQWWYDVTMCSNGGT